MATGDNDDLTARVTRLLPPWFADSNPVLGGLVAGIGAALSFVYRLIIYAAAQTRIATATGTWLDLIAYDFFGTELRRNTNETDDRFRTRIVANLFRERATRAGMIAVLTELTGAVPTIFEPMRPADTGGYGVQAGYSLSGGYGSILLPFQAFITVNIPVELGIPGVAGYRVQTGGYSQPSRLKYATLFEVADRPSLADIYAAIERTKPIGSIMWTAIGPNVSRLPAALGINFVLGNSPLGA